MKLAYYPGCVAQESGKELDMATRWVAKAVGIELVPFPSFSCCGSGFMDEANQVLNVALNARNLAIAEKAGLDILTICSTCQGMLTLANVRSGDAKIKARVDGALRPLGIEDPGTTKVKHLLQVLTEDIGLEAIRAKVTRPLEGLKVGAFYGCHLLRPVDELGWESAEEPHAFEDLLAVLGATPVYYRGRVMCCGFPIQFVKPETASRIAGNQILDAQAHGADAMATALPAVPPLARRVPESGGEGRRSFARHAGTSPPAGRGSRPRRVPGRARTFATSRLHGGGHREGPGPRVGRGRPRPLLL